MDLQPSGQTAYITGGAQGIGAPLAARLASEGVRVAVTDIDGAQLHASAADWRSDAEESVLIEADLCSADEVANVVQQALDGLGSVPDLLVNNVGLAISRSFRRHRRRTLGGKLPAELHELRAHQPAAAASNGRNAVAARWSTPPPTSPSSPSRCPRTTAP